MAQHDEPLKSTKIQLERNWKWPKLESRWLKILNGLFFSSSFTMTIIVLFGLLLTTGIISVVDCTGVTLNRTWTTTQPISDSMLSFFNRDIGSSPLMIKQIRRHQQQLIDRQRRALPQWEAYLNTVKCSLKILGLQVSQHHNNMIMCCGLWKMKSFMKDSASQVCENPAEAHVVFDDFMTDELIYGRFTQSILGDENLNCQHYPESSIECERFWALITMAIIMLVLFFLSILVTCWISCICWCRYRRKYHRLLRCKVTDDQSYDSNHEEKDYFLNKGDKSKMANLKMASNKSKKRFWMQNIRNDVFKADDASKKKPFNNNNNNNSVSYSSDQSQVRLGTDKDKSLNHSEADSTSANTLMVSLNDTSNEKNC